MALPTIYTEETLAAFMRDCLKTIAKDLGWTTDAPFAEPINETLLAYSPNGVTPIADATDIARLRALARIEAWRAVVEGTTGDYDASSKDDEMKRSQVNAQAKSALADARNQLTELLDDRAVAAAVPEPTQYSGVVRVVSTW